MFLVVAFVLVSASAFAADKPKPWRAPIDGGTRQLLDCSNARVLPCPGTVTGDNTGMVNNVMNYSCTGWNEIGGEEVWVLELPPPSCWIVSISSDFTYSPDLDMFFLGSCDEGDCIIHGDSGLTTACLDPGTYYLVVDGYGSTSNPGGPYTLTVECTECDCPVPPCCPFPWICEMFDFNLTPGNTMLMPCGSGVPVWQWGMDQENIPDIACDDVPVTNVWGTVLNGTYSANSGEILVVPVFLDDCCWCMEICHFIDTEGYWDGGNVKVSVDGGATWQLITPANGYPEDACSTGNACIPGEPAFSGHLGGFFRDCFDMSAFTGMDILVGFFFGSDGSVQYPGWYIKWVAFGGYEPSTTDETSWGGVKAMYR
jgi:hypothetical protein